MKTRKKLIIGVVALCVMLIATVGIVSAVLAATSATASATFTVSYTATPQVNASVGASYGIATYGTDASSSAFTPFKVNDVSSITNPHRFYPTSSTAALNFDAIVLNDFSGVDAASKYLVVKYVFKNYATRALKVKATITQTKSSQDLEYPFITQYCVPSTTGDVTFTSSENGSITAPTLSNYVSNTTELTISAKGANEYSESHIYLVFTLNDAEQYGGSLQSIVWNLDPVTTT